MSIGIISFTDALALSDKIDKKRHVLLGNGFSIAYDPTSFTYGKLLDEADFSEISIDARALFDRCGTVDFERIVEVLEVSDYLLGLYGVSDPLLRSSMKEDSGNLKDALAEVLSRRHPDHVGMLSDVEYAAVRKFLSNFERIYSLNYDLLLYWATMQDGEPAVSRNDGFGESEAFPGAGWVAWRPTMMFDLQRVFYLHGALHLYDAGSELRKITWNRTGERLLDQVRTSLGQGMYPLVVTEGSSVQKLGKILHSAYLTHALRSFSSIGGSLFVYGLSLADNDAHIIRQIERSSRIKALFVGLFGDPNSQGNLDIRNRIELLNEVRKDDGKGELTVHYFDSQTASVWR